MKDSLTPHQEKIVAMWCEECLTNKEVAVRLNLSTKTVDAHRSQIYTKLGTRSITELSKWYWSRKYSSVGAIRKL